ncbi:hypothetical protein APUTEX25_004848, partial [Auxenochlorella protothecoides]
HKGFSKAGSTRTSTLHIPGQKACTADSDGNIGAGNKGKNNFGTKNDGNNNIGNANVGNANWGNNNKGTGNRCFNKTGDRKIVSDCSLLEFRKY